MEAQPELWTAGAKDGAQWRHLLQNVLPIIGRSTWASDLAQWAAEGKTHDGLRLLCSSERDPFSPVLRRQAEGCCFLLRPRRCQALCQAWRQYFLHRATAPPGTSDKVCRHFWLFPVGGKGCCSHGVERSQGWWC